MTWLIAADISASAAEFFIKTNAGGGYGRLAADRLVVPGQLNKRF